ncbi:MULTISPECIES: DUF4232 domain-containing protein [unclassified Streptomyces]|uniref:DUF4232 domain-containing protein n=1 Tax=unclassified Streptomyces TaxID=2593676 RepID=UPI002E2B8FD6|nr:DUF4232 domain-containing protein [Streptomyces sp. NBC_00223]
MRVQKISVIALVAVTVGLSLTACDSDDANGSSTSSSSPTSAAAPTQGGTGSASPTAPQADTSVNGKGAAATSDSGKGSSDGSGTADGGVCQTAHLSFTSSFGMAEGEVLINLTNTGAGACTMHGFPGVDLKGRYGTVSAERSHVTAPDVTLRSGEATRFTLHFPPNNSGGSGVTFTSLVVTPPNETHSHTMALSINIPAGDGSGPTITVDPVGAGK